MPNHPAQKTPPQDKMQRTNKIQYAPLSPIASALLDRHLDRLTRRPTETR